MYPITKINNIFILIAGLSIAPAHAQNPAAGLGKDRAAASKLEWDVKEAGHPVLGDIRFGVLKNPVETPVGNAKVFSRAFVSCQKARKMIAIELANGKSPDDKEGLRPNADPRLVCSRPEKPGSDKLVKEDLLANWEVNELGDAMAKGFRSFPLRECVSIGVIQEVALPAGWAKKSTRVEFEIAPYNRDLDSVFATCGDVAAYAPSAPAAPPKTVVAAAPPASPPPAAPPKPAPVAVQPPKIAPAPVAAPPKAVPAPAPVATPPAAPAQPAAANGPWVTARVSASGKTNVRGGPNLTSAIVITLDPGAIVMVQKTGNDWWRARPSAGTAYEGYIREDRLVFK